MSPCSLSSALLNCSTAECHYERCKCQRSEVKCLGINSWRDDYRPQAVRGDLSGLVPVHHQREGWKITRRVWSAVVEFTLSGLLLQCLMLWSWAVHSTVCVCEKEWVCITAVCVFVLIKLCLYSTSSVFLMSVCVYRLTPISMCACVCVLLDRRLTQQLRPLPCGHCSQ